MRLRHCARKSHRRTIRARYCATPLTPYAAPRPPYAAPSPPLYTTLVNTDDAGELARQLVCAANRLAREGR